MIGWLLDLIFSNFWLVILLFWVFRLFSKGFKEATGNSSRPRRHQPHQPHQPREVTWETNFEEVLEPIGPVEIKPEMKIDSSQKEKQPLKKENSTVEPLVLPSPVQGMIWSQVYGPPRSKNLHRSRKTW